jgi:hypothetical protein
LQEFRGIGPKTASIFIDELLQHGWHFSSRDELPTLQMKTTAQQEPLQRNLLMIVAHII